MKWTNAAGKMVQIDSTHNCQKPLICKSTILAMKQSTTKQSMPCTWKESVGSSLSLTATKCGYKPSFDYGSENIESHNVKFRLSVIIKHIHLFLF